jgi:urease accessory protein
MTFVSPNLGRYRRNVIHPAGPAMNVSSPRLRVFALFAMLLPASVWAHPADQAAHDAIAGMVHPFTGVDHVLAMIAVGLWAVRLGRRATFTLPLVFPLMMLMGGLFASAGLVLPALEPMIALSVIAFGLLIAAGVRLPIFTSALLVGVFAIFHGYAHVNESSSGAVGAYSAGFVLSTLVLHVLGIAIGAAMSRTTSAALFRTGGSLLAVAGTVLLLAG